MGLEFPVRANRPLPVEQQAAPWREREYFCVQGVGTDTFLYRNSTFTRKITKILFRLGTDATVADRYPIVTVNSPAVNPTLSTIAKQSGLPSTAGHTNWYFWAIGLSQFSQNINNQFNFENGLTDILLKPGENVQFTVENGQAADNVQINMEMEVVV